MALAASGSVVVGPLEGVPPRTGEFSERAKTYMQLKMVLTELRRVQQGSVDEPRATFKEPVRVSDVFSTRGVASELKAAFANSSSASLTDFDLAADGSVRHKDSGKLVVPLEGLAALLFRLVVSVYIDALAGGGKGLGLCGRGARGVAAAGLPVPGEPALWPAHGGRKRHPLRGRA